MIQVKVIREVDTSIKKMSPKFRLKASLYGIFLINDSCGRVESIMGSSIPGVVVLGSIIKQTE